VSISRPDAYITEVRTANRKVWDGINALIILQREWMLCDYTTTLPPGTGDNEGITSQEVSDVVNTTTDALNALLEEGHALNMSKLF
jgi:hypothetical protein